MKAAVIVDSTAYLSEALAQHSSLIQKYAPEGLYQISRQMSCYVVE